MKDKDLLVQLKIPPLSLHIQDLRAAIHNRLTLITTFGQPKTSLALLEKLRRRISVDFMRNWPHETLADIQAARFARMETMRIEARLDQEGKVPPA